MSVVVPVSVVVLVSVVGVAGPLPARLHRLHALADLVGVSFGGPLRGRGRLGGAAPQLRGQAGLADPARQTVDGLVRVDQGAGAAPRA